PIAPMLGPFGFPQNCAISLTTLTEHVMQYIPSEITFWDRLNGIQWKFGTQQFFQRQFLHFTLQLLRTLLSFLFEFFYLLLHGDYGLIFFHHFQFETLFCFTTRMRAHYSQIFLHSLLNGQFQFTFSIVQLTLFLDELYLRMLSFSQLLVAYFEQFLKISQLPT